MSSNAPAPRTTIVTDSSACLPPDLLQELDIITVPLHFQFDGEQHRDGELPPADFYHKLAVSSRPPTTSAPASGEFLDAFRRAAGQGASAVLCLTLSAEFSGTYQSARNAAEAARTDLPDLRIDVGDTGGLAMTHGFAVLAAARALREGRSLKDAARMARSVGGRAEMIGMLHTLRFLARGGRIPWVVHWAASLLRIRPVMAFGQGKPRSVGRVRTDARGMDELVRFLHRRAGPPERLHVAVMHANAPGLAGGLAGAVQQALQPAELLVTEFTAVMGVHTGPGFVGLAFYTDEGLLEFARADAADLRAMRRDARVLLDTLGEIPATTGRPVAVVLSGPPGSGKSHLARALAERHPFAHMDSDRLRRALFKRPAYTQPESRRLFTAYHEAMDRLLAGGVSVICDATNLKEEYRRPLYQIAEQRKAALVVVRVEAPRKVVEKRLDSRLRGAGPWDQSEAGHDIYRRMKAEAEPIQHDHLVVEASGDISGAVERILRTAGLATARPRA